MADTVHIRGIRAEGHHGASRGEQDTPQHFEVDVDLGVEPLDDDLGTTADYRVVVYAVQELVEKKSFALIETMAARISEAVLAIPGVNWCRATVRKPRAAGRLGVDEVAASAEAGKRR